MSAIFQDIKTWGLLTLIALCASTLRLPEIIKDKDGRTRWGMVFLQFPTAFTMVVLAKAAEPAVLYWFPYAGAYVAHGLTAALVLWGPLAAPKLIDALVERVRGKP